ncbi:hypothetical protein [Kitasatospora sp. KL5]|uniref:hypothetical protein n=1 Tax=Kitasatospora sp. KL5 TaxID=3425125 RepID=UPI003D701E40
MSPARSDGPWLGWSYGLQLHRANTVWAMAEPALVERYGPLTGLLPFDDLAAEAGHRDLPLVELPAASPGCREYWQPSTSVSVLVIEGGYGVEPEEIGTVHRIGGPVTPEHLLWRCAHERVRAFKQTADHLAAAPPAGRERWLANRPPELPADELWWRRMLAALRMRRHDRPQNAGALADAYLWLLDEARARGTLDTLQTALLCADLDHPASADRTVRECLALLTDATPHPHRPRPARRRPPPPAPPDGPRPRRRPPHARSSTAGGDGVSADPAIMLRWLPASTPRAPDAAANRRSPTGSSAPTRPCVSGRAASPV